MSGALYSVGFIVRESGRALDRLGCLLQGKNGYLEQFWRHKPLQNLGSARPVVGEGAFVAPSATLVGNVSIGENANVWYGAVLRGDGAPISVGRSTNIQDGVLIQSSKLSPEAKKLPLRIGDNVTIGHGAVLTGVQIEDSAFIGIGAVLQEGTQVESGAMVAAGAVVAPGSIIPKGELWAGNPAKYMRSLKPEEKDFILPSASKYVELASQHQQAA